MQVLQERSHLNFRRPGMPSPSLGKLVRSLDRPYLQCPPICLEQRNEQHSPTTSRYVKGLPGPSGLYPPGQVQRVAPVFTDM